MYIYIYTYKYTYSEEYIIPNILQILLFGMNGLRVAYTERYSKQKTIEANGS